MPWVEVFDRLTSVAVYSAAAGSFLFLLWIIVTPWLQ